MILIDLDHFNTFSQFSIKQIEMEFISMECHTCPRRTAMHTNIYGTWKRTERMGVKNEWSFDGIWKGKESWKEATRSFIDIETSVNISGFCVWGSLWSSQSNFIFTTIVTATSRTKTASSTREAQGWRIVAIITIILRHCMLAFTGIKTRWNQWFPYISLFVKCLA